MGLLQRQEVEIKIPENLTWVLSSLNAAGQPGTQISGDIAALQQQPGQGAIQGCRRIVQSMVMDEGAHVGRNTLLPL